MKQNWTYKKLGDVATFSRGLTYAKGDVADESTKKVLRSNNIDLSSHSLVFDDVAYLKEDFIIPDEKKLHKGDIFICMSNGSTQHLGKVAFIEDDIDYAFGGFMGAIHPNQNEVFPKFVFYACLSQEYRSFLASIFNGVNINNLKWSDLSTFSIPVPPLPEQSRIVSELDLLQSIIDKQKAQLSELDNLAQAVFYDMFGDPVENEKGWEVKKLGEVCEITSSKRVYQSEWQTTGIPFYRISDFTQLIEKGNVNTELFISEGKYEELKSNGLVPNTGDILITSRGTLGNCYIVKNNDRFYFQDGMITWLKPNKELVCPLFIAFLFKSNSFRKQIDQNQSGTTVAYLSISMLKKFDFPIPPLSLQQSFAAKIESIEKQKAAISKSIAETEKLFEYTMDKYFG